MASGIWVVVDFWILAAVVGGGDRGIGVVVAAVDSCIVLTLMSDVFDQESYSLVWSLWLDVAIR